MPPNSTPATTATQIEKRLAELQLRLRIPMIQRRIRDELFSESERQLIEAESKTRTEAERKRIEAEGKKRTEAKLKQIEAGSKTRTEAERKRIEAEGKKRTDAKVKQIEAEDQARQDAIGLWSRFKKVSPARAIADLAFATDLHSPGQHTLLLRNLGEAAMTVNRDAAPEWNRETCELRYGGEVVRRVRGVKIAKNLVAILDEFQGKNWPERIDNPLPDPVDKQKLRETIATLNTGLSKIVFRADGSGSGVIWGLRTDRAPPARRP